MSLLTEFLLSVPGTFSSSVEPFLRLYDGVRPLSISPVAWLSRRVSNSDDVNFLTETTEDNLKRKSSHKIKLMAIVAERKSLGIIENRANCCIEFSVKVAGCCSATRRIPAERFGILPFCVGINDNLSLQVQRPSVLVFVHQANQMRPLRLHQRHRYGDWPHRPSRHSVEPSPLEM